jgi:beta-ketoacyl-acyl-carrier-protein synthase II
MRKVVVTGLGVVCAVGHDVDAFHHGLTAGRSGLGRVQAFDPDWYHTQVGAEVRDYSFDHLMSESDQRQIDRQALLALAAADEAVRRSGFDSSRDPERCGVVLGTGMGPSDTHEEAIRTVVLEEKKPRPTTIPKAMHNAAAGHVSMRWQCRGPSEMVTTACASSAHAIAHAVSYLRTGVADAVLAGGSESFPGPCLFAAWDTLRVMSRDNDHPERSCRPFAKDREGFVIGEGAALLVLETEERAKARGAEILAEIAGFGLSSDASHITRPQLDGFCAALRNALRDARIEPAEVQYVNAHGTGTAANDPLESEALHQVFGDHAKRLMISSTKSGHGHTIGAAAAIEAAATILGLNHGFVPPTLHLDEPDPACDLDYVPHEARAARFDVALSNSFAFGGHNVVLVLRRPR